MRFVVSQYKRSQKKASANEARIEESLRENLNGKPENEKERTRKRKKKEEKRKKRNLRMKNKAQRCPINASCLDIRC